MVCSKKTAPPEALTLSSTGKLVQSELQSCGSAREVAGENLGDAVPQCPSKSPCIFC